jgi:hypothetical protein
MAATAALSTTGRGDGREREHHRRTPRPTNELDRQGNWRASTALNSLALDGRDRLAQEFVG